MARCAIWVQLHEAKLSAITSLRAVTSGIST